MHRLLTQPRSALYLFLSAAMLMAWPAHAQDEPAAEPDQAVEEFQIPEEERPFWDSAQKFVDAYARRDAAALGELFTEGAAFYTESGELLRGRDEIVAAFEATFADSPEVQIDEILLEKIRRVTPTVAIEEGVVVSTEFAGAPAVQSRYIAVHVQGDDKQWRIDVLKDYAQVGLDRGAQLDRLAWMLGNWVNEDAESTVRTVCDWSEDGNFLLRRFQVEMSDGSLLKGTQRIGWDPVRGELRSWTFDSEGGFLEGCWKQSGSQWVVVSTGVNGNGETTHATAVYEVIDAEMVTWKYQHLVIGNEVHGEIEPIIMVRQPPGPSSDSENEE